MAKRTFSVLLEPNSKTVKETITFTEPGNPDPNVKKLKTKLLKKAYRDQMKDPSKYADTDMADSDHPSLIIRHNGNPTQSDEVTFFYFEEFAISLTRDPKVDDDPGGPDVPFTKSVGGTDIEFTFDVGEQVSPPPGDLRFAYKAGPYKVGANAFNQRFYKFSVSTKSGLALDPDIITEP